MIKEANRYMGDWKDSLIQYFRDRIKTEGNPVLGVEVEHFILDDKGKAVPYAGDKGIRRILQELMTYYPDAKIIPDDDFLGFSVPDFTVTLEPAAQLEISIVPIDEISRVGDIYLGFRKNLDNVLERSGYEAVNFGCHPVSKPGELKLIPKRRYDLMDKHFKGTGTGGVEMMRGTASLQISLDYRSEKDFCDKIRAAYYFGPVLKLLCDNSPSFGGEDLKIRLKRTDIWRRVDKGRCGILPHIFSGTYGFKDYADFTGDLIPIFLKYDKEIIPTGKRTVEEIFEGRDMNESEIAHVLSMGFPDVRLKGFLEVRFADSVPFPFMMAYCALIKGLLYSEEGIAYAKDRIEHGGITETDIINAEDELMAHGWKAVVYGREVSELTKELLDIARRNLSKAEEGYIDTFDTVVEYGGILNIPEEKSKELMECAKG